MESLETCLTNVLKIENLSRIPYTIYRPSASSPNPNLPSSLNRRDTNILRHAERCLRREGTIVLADRDKAELWIFQIEGFPQPSPNRGKDGSAGGVNSNNGVGDDAMEGEVQAQIAEEETEGKWKRLDGRLREEWGLRESTTGTLLASTLAPPAPPPTATFRSASSASTPLTPSFPPNTPGMFPTTIDLTEDDPSPSSSSAPHADPEDRHAPYKHFIAAVLHSLLFTLALLHSYTPLNIRTLVAPSWAPAKDKSDDPLLPSSPLLLPEVVRPTVLALEAYLTTTGTLLIVPHTETQPAIRRVGSALLVEEGGGRDVYIAPWGEWGRLLPVEDALTGKEERWKRDVRSYLQDCGVLATPEEGWEREWGVLEKAVEEGTWRKVEIWVPFKELPGMGMVVKVLWPEALLFVKASEDDPVLALAPEKNVGRDTTSIEDPTAANAQDDDHHDDHDDHDDDLWWKSVFTSPEYSRFASGGLSISLASLVLSSGVGTKYKDLGADWWDVPSAVDWAEDWLNTKDERARIIKARSEEKKRARRAKQAEEKAEQAEKLEKKTSELEVAAKSEPEVMDIQEEGKAKPKVEAKNSSGVYPTPPDGGAGQQHLTQGPGSAISGSAPNTAAAVPAAPTSAVATEMDLDWIGDGPNVADLVPEGRKQSDAAAIGGLAGGTGEADLFGGDMDEDEMFGQGITEDDFAFFDGPGDLGGFEDGDELGDDVDMGLGEVGMDLSGMEMEGAGGVVDLTMETPGQQEMIVVSSPIVPMIQLPTGTAGVGRVKPTIVSMDKLPEMEPHIQTPPLSPHRAIRLLVPEYSLSPNNQPHPTPPTTGSMVMKTPQQSGAPPPPMGGVSEAKRRMSLYSPITFTTTVEMADRKYAPGGRYFLPESIKEKEQKEFESKQGKLESPTKVQSGGLKRKRGVFMSRVIAVEENNDAAPEMAEVLIGGDDAVMEESPEGEDEDDSESGWTESSVESDADDETEGGEEEEPGGRYCNSPLAAVFGGGGRKRKWAFDEEGDGGVVEPMERDVDVGADGEVEVVGEMAPPPWDVMVPDPTDSSLIGVFANMSLETDAISLAGLGEGEFNAVSKLVREQIVTGTSKPLGTLIGGGAWEPAMEDDDEEWCLLRRRKCKDEGIVEDAVKGLFGTSGVVRCTLETYVAVADAAIEPILVGRAAAMRPLPQPRRGVPALNKRVSAIVTGASDATGSVSAIFRLKPPHIHIHRAEQALEILPPSLHFWETFGFAPCGGPKNVIGFCLHPASKQMEEAADGFLERVQCAYEGARFGTHVRGRLDSSGITDGTVAVAKGGSGLERGVKALMDAMGDFGAVLANVADELQNIVVYVVNPFEHPSAVVDICAGFVMMRRIYTRTMEGVMNARSNNLVLQIVPARSVAAKLGSVSRAQSEWHTLASEVYNRCVPTDGIGSLEEAQKTFSPSIYLSRPPPKSIDFRLTEPSSSLLYENSILHCAYAQSIDERWVSVAWTDNWGQVQSTESYCLGRKGCTVLRVFEDVCREIWSKTIEIARFRKIHWRLMFVKVGAMMADEIDVWARLSKSSTPSLSHSLTLLSADVAPPLTVIPVLPPIVPTHFNPLVSIYTGTPPGVTTPTPGGNSIVSPDQFGGAANTPSADPLPDLDPGSNLVDFGDETWGVVCAHRWRRGLLLSQDDGSFGGGCMGYLVKRGGTGEGDEMVVLQVEVVRGGGGNSLLREVLGAYRGLVTLGQFKGVVQMGGRGSVVPWHVGAAWKGVEVLGLVM